MITCWWVNFTVGKYSSPLICPTNDQNVILWSGGWFWKGSESWCVAGNGRRLNLSPGLAGVHVTFWASFLQQFGENVGQEDLVCSSLWVWCFMKVSNHLKQNYHDLHYWTFGPLTSSHTLTVLARCCGGSLGCQFFVFSRNFWYHKKL